MWRALGSSVAVMAAGAGPAAVRIEQATDLGQRVPADGAHHLHHCAAGCTHASEAMGGRLLCMCRPASSRYIDHHHPFLKTAPHGGRAACMAQRTSEPPAPLRPCPPTLLGRLAEVLLHKQLARVARAVVAGAAALQRRRVETCRALGAMQAPPRPQAGRRLQAQAQKTCCGRAVTFLCIRGISPPAPS